MKIKTILKSYKFYSYWWNIRFLAILSSPVLFFEFEWYFLIQVLIIIHAKFGVKNIIWDYINCILLQLCYLSLIRVSLIQFIKINIEFYF